MMGSFCDSVFGTVVNSFSFHFRREMADVAVLHLLAKRWSYKLRFAMLLLLMSLLVLWMLLVKTCW